MTWRAGHGNGKGSPRIEVMPPDELPAGVPDHSRGESPTDRGNGGRFAPGNSLARVGGATKAGRVRLAERLGLGDVPDDAAFAPYRRSAVSFRRAQCAALARSVGGGICGPAPSSLVASASIQLAWSRFFSDLASSSPDPDLVLKASRLAEASRQSLMAAHELCAKEAQARPEPYFDVGAAIRAGLPPEQR